MKGKIKLFPEQNDYFAYSSILKLFLIHTTFYFSSPYLVNHESRRTDHRFREELIREKNNKASWREFHYNHAWKRRAEFRGGATCGDSLRR